MARDAAEDNVMENEQGRKDRVQKTQFLVIHDLTAKCIPCRNDKIK